MLVRVGDIDGWGNWSVVDILDLPLDADTTILSDVGLLLI